MISPPNIINAAICRALNIDPARVRRVVITLEADRLATVEVTRLAGRQDADGLATVVEVMRLHALPEPTANEGALAHEH